MVLETIFQLFLALFLGLLIGLEREVKKRGAGLQTFGLISLASCFFMIIPLETHQELLISSFIGAVIFGIGIVAAGTILHKEDGGTEGLTTAAAILATSAIGVMTGLKLYILAIFSSFLIILILAGLGLVEEKIFKN